jgi:hypothetical protein
MLRGSWSARGKQADIVLVWGTATVGTGTQITKGAQDTWARASLACGWSKSVWRLLTELRPASCVLRLAFSNLDLSCRAHRKSKHGGGAWEKVSVLTNEEWVRCFWRVAGRHQ